MAGQAKAIRGRTNKAALLLALLLGAAAALLTFIYLSQQEDKQTTPATVVTRPVVVAKSDIPARTRITADMVAVEQMPETAIHAEAFTAVDNRLVGQVTRFPVAKDEQVLTGKVALAAALGAAGDQAGQLPLSLVIPPGKRAMSIRVSETVGAGGLILAGDFVDVVAIFEVEGAGSPSDPRSQEDATKALAVTLLQNIEVLAVAQTVAEVTPEERSATTDQTVAAQETATPDGGERLPVQSGEPNPGAKTVTLALTPEQAALLFLAEQNGTLRLTLRPFGDSEEVPVQPIPGIDLIPEEALAFFSRP